MCDSALSSPDRVVTAEAASTSTLTPDKRPDEVEKEYDSDGCEISAGTMKVLAPPKPGEVRALLFTNSGYDNFWFSFEPVQREKGLVCKNGKNIVCPFASIHMHGGNRFGFSWNAKCENPALQYYTIGQYERIVELAPIKFPATTFTFPDSPPLPILGCELCKFTDFKFIGENGPIHGPAIGIFFTKGCEKNFNALRTEVEYVFGAKEYKTAWQLPFAMTTGESYAPGWVWINPRKDFKQYKAWLNAEKITVHKGHSFVGQA